MEATALLVYCILISLLWTDVVVVFVRVFVCLFVCVCLFVFCFFVVAGFCCLFVCLFACFLSLSVFHHQPFAIGSG